MNQWDMTDEQIEDWNKAERQRTAAAKKTSKRPEAGSTEWVGEAPPLTPEAEEDWWWVVSRDEWCVSTVRYEEEQPWHAAYLRVSFTRADGTHSWMHVEAKDSVRWGGRIAVPGAFPTAKSQRKRGERAEFQNKPTH